MNTRKVLVVDDAATIRMYHGTILRDAGFTVTDAANGYEGLEAAMAETFDLMVIDVNMPHLDGYSLVEAVRHDGPNRGTPIVMVTTEDNVTDGSRGYTVGANVCLAKPVSADTLARAAVLLTGGPS